MSKDEILAKVRDILVDQLGVDAERRHAGGFVPG